MSEFLNIDRHYQPKPPSNFNPRRKLKPSKSFESAIRCIFNHLLPDEADKINSDFIRHLASDMKSLRMANKIYALSPESNEFFYTLSFLYNINIYLSNTDTLYTHSLLGWKRRPIIYIYRNNQHLFSTTTQSSCDFTISYQYAPGMSKYMAIKFDKLKEIASSLDISIEKYNKKSFLVEQIMGIDDVINLNFDK